MTNNYCYQCDKLTAWLAPDGRCGGCTRYTPEEIQGSEIGKNKTKARITITLSDDVLLELDKTIANRSQYIDWLIRQDLKIEFKPIKK